MELVTAVGLLFAMIAVLRLMAAAADRLEAKQPPDPILDLWHRYEEGDLTRQEFERLRRSFPKAPVSRMGRGRRVKVVEEEMHHASAP